MLWVGVRLDSEQMSCFSYPLALHLSLGSPEVFKVGGSAQLSEVPERSLSGQTQAELLERLTGDLSSSDSGIHCPLSSTPQSRDGLGPWEDGKGCWVGEAAYIARTLKGTSHGCQSSRPQAADLFFLGISCVSVPSCVNKQQTGEQRQGLH